MAEYTVTFIETVTVRVDVTADTEEQAKEMILEGDYLTQRIVASEIDEIVEVKLAKD